MAKATRGFDPGIEITRDLIAANPDAALEQIHALIEQSTQSGVVIEGLQKQVNDWQGTRTDLERMTEQHAAALRSAADKDTAINALKGELADTNAQKSSLLTGNEELVQAYRDQLLKNEPSLPPSLISGGTLNEIQASVEAARGVVQHVQGAIASPAASGRMPSGAPMRTVMPDVKTMTPIEKITYGARQVTGEEMTG